MCGPRCADVPPFSDDAAQRRRNVNQLNSTLPGGNRKSTNQESRAHFSHSNRTSCGPHVIAAPCHSMAAPEQDRYCGGDQRRWRDRRHVAGAWHCKSGELVAARMRFQPVPPTSPDAEIVARYGLAPPRHTGMPLAFGCRQHEDGFTSRHQVERATFEQRRYQPDRTQAPEASFVLPLLR
jgi:hypothetical protein